MTLDAEFTEKDVDIIKSKTAYNGFFKIKKILLQHKLFQGGLSDEIKRELFCRGTSVGVLLYDPDSDRVGLVQQFRIGCLQSENGPWVWEVIAGINDKQESSMDVAIREVREESGLSLMPESLTPICEYFASPGGSDEQLQLYCGITPFDNEQGIFGLKEESEDILFKTFAYDQVISAMLEGRINNAATIIALQWLQLNREKLQAK